MPSAETRTSVGGDLMDGMGKAEEEGSEIRISTATRFSLSHHLPQCAQVALAQTCQHSVVFGCSWTMVNSG